MNLSKLDKRILRFIERTYPKVWDAESISKIRTATELPLTTVEMLLDEFKKYPLSAIESVVSKLKSFSLIGVVYLYGKSDFAEVPVSAGATLRSAYQRQGSGCNGYQITEFGKETLAKTIRGRVTTLGEAFLKTAVPDLLKWCGGILIGAIAVYFGFNPGCVRQSTPSQPPESRPQIKNPAIE